MDSKGRPDRREGKEVSGGHLFSPWENPQPYERIRYGCGHKAIVCRRKAQQKIYLQCTLTTKISTPRGWRFFDEEAGLESPVWLFRLIYIEFCILLHALHPMRSADFPGREKRHPIRRNWWGCHSTEKRCTREKNRRNAQMILLRCYILQILCI